MSEASSAHDQRDYFRIDEDVLFEYKAVSNDVADTHNPDDVFEDSSGGIDLINQLKRLEKDSVQSLKLLSDKNRLLGDYLASLGKRIDLVARHVAFNNEESLSKRPKTRISLSEDGVGFLSERPFYKSSMLALRVIFLPNYEVVNIFAQVVRCISRDETNQVAARFHRITDKDRQVISRHILRSQVRQRSSQ